MEFGLKGKYALITGGTHGIGKATALTLAQEGCHVAVCSPTVERIDQTLSELAAYNVRTIGMQADALSGDDMHRVMDRIESEWGELDILINNVGGGGRWGKPSPEETDERVWYEVHEKNAMAAMRCTMRALPMMKKKNWGRVVTVTSLLGRQGGGRPWFNMAKAAQTSMMKCLALDHSLSKPNITLNSVAPGGIFIPGTGFEEESKSDPEAFETWVAEHFPRERMGTAQEVANAIVFLCSEGASLINGAVIAADGAEGVAF